MCQNSCQRPCCDQGEKVDQIRAEKAVTALLKPEEKTMKFGTFFDENESSNDSIISLEMTGTSDGSVESESEGEGNLYIVEEDVSEKTSAENNNEQVMILHNLLFL